MNDTQFKRAISEALTKEYEMSVPTHNADHEFSDEFNRKMDTLINRQKKPYYKMINTFVKRVACVIVAVFIASFTTIMSVSALRNAFKDFFMSIFSDHSEISAGVDSSDTFPTTIQSDYNITYDLSNYKIIYEEYDELSRNISYQKDNIVIDYFQYVKSEYDMGLNTEDAEISTITVDDTEAIYYLDNNDYSNIIWDNGEYIIMISSNIGKNELINIANSVQKVE
jgi:hypothetical protein